MSAVRILALLVVVFQGACEQPGLCSAGHADALSTNAVERRIEAILPKDWKVASRMDGAVPYGIIPGRGRSEASSVFLMLVGPERVEISGYYCAHGSYCSQPIVAREAVEVWIMSAAFADFAGPPAATTRGASLIASCHGRAVYALASRYAGEAIDFDAGFTGSSTETSRMPQTSGDLPISWGQWRQALEAVVQ